MQGKNRQNTKPERKTLQKKTTDSVRKRQRFTI